MSFPAIFRFTSILNSLSTVVAGVARGRVIIGTEDLRQLDDDEQHDDDDDDGDHDGRGVAIVLLENS